MRSSVGECPAVLHMGTFEEVYRQHVQVVFRVALRSVGRRDLADDLTSEAFLALWRNFEGIDQSQLPAWLIAVVRNRARDWWRRQQLEDRYIAQAIEQPVAHAPPMEEPSMEAWILECADLKPVHRTCVMLRYVHGMTRGEIASALSLSENQVKGNLQYALTLLRKAHGRTIDT